MSPPSQRPRPLPGGATRLDILIADGDATLRSMLAIVLRREGHRVVEIGDGAALAGNLGQRLAGRSTPADLLVLADLRLPELDALTIFRSVAEPRPAFVLMTAFASSELRAVAARLGALAVLDKPFDFEHLRAIVRTVALRAAREGDTA